jgi:parvulin-like peptidyl-prolyl isomerase
MYQGALKLGMDIDQDFRYELEKAKKELLVRRYLNRLLEKEVKVTDSEIETYYNENKDNFTHGDDEIRALHILVATKPEADDVRERLMRGEDFVELAKEVSLDYERNKRIELDFFSKNDVVQEIAALIFSFRVGNITQPITSDFGWHIFKILEKRPKGFQKDLAEVRDKIVTRLAATKRTERYNALLVELKNKVNIKTNENILKAMYKDSTVTIKDLSLPEHE